MLENFIDDDIITPLPAFEAVPDYAQEKARTHLNTEDGNSGDTELLGWAISMSGINVVVTDDKPLRKTCKAFSIPVSGSIGVLVRAVERGGLDADVAKDKLYAMDEVGARLSASLIKRAESLIEEAEKS